MLLMVDWVELHENTIPESLEKKILVLYGGKLTLIICFTVIMDLKSKFF